LTLNLANPHRSKTFGAYGNYENAGNYGSPGNHESSGPLGAAFTM
jgi:hypothetical protein